MSTLMDNVLKILPDKLYLQLKYFYRFHKFPNLRNPQTYNEKLQWLKLYDRKPIYTQMADKYEAKNYVKNLIGEEYIVPSYGVWNSFDEIDFDILPNQFVLKCTHDSGGIVICKDKKSLDINNAKAINYRFATGSVTLRPVPGDFKEAAQKEQLFWQ